MEQTSDYVRLVGLSATLPNYQDVATFLRVDQSKGLFHFDASYRPCALQQQFLGVTFVHSRKETAKTAKFIRDMAIEKESITQFVKPNSAVREILTEEVNKCQG
jgi:pre-mRNA-splicing helicase BRR2